LVSFICIRQESEEDKNERVLEEPIRIVGIPDIRIDPAERKNDPENLEPKILSERIALF
jgi:hypothetical protein